MELAILALAGVSLLAFAGFVLLRLWRGRRSGISIRMQVFVSMAAVSGAFAFLLGLIAIERLEARSGLLAAEVAQEDADLVARLLAASGQPLSTLARSLSEQSLAGVRPDGLRIEILDAEGRLVHAAGPTALTRSGAHKRAPIVLSGQRLGEVRISRATLGVGQILRDVAFRATVLTLLLVIGTAVAAALVGRAIAVPIERLTQAASRIAHGERQEALPRPVGREVRTLTAAVESMRRELEGRHLAEGLAQDLSHQLKNPVAAIRAAAEVLADGALEEPQTARRFVGRILEATERMLALVNNLLALTRLQARGVEHELLDLAEQVDLAADAHAAQAEKRRLSIEVHASGPAVVRGDAAWLRRAIDNLIDNALAFAQPEQLGAPAAAPSAQTPSRRAYPRAVVVTVRGADSKVVLEVANAGPGVAQQVRGRLFERFVTTRHNTGGSGLGLAIVAAVAEQHGGQVEVLDPAPGPAGGDGGAAGGGGGVRWTVFRMTLPRASTTLHQIFP